LKDVVLIINGLIMNCNNFSNNILPYIDKELSQEQSSVFSKHMNSCSTCKQLFDEISATYKLIEVENDMPKNPFFYHKLISKIQHQKQDQASNILMNVLKPLAVAASIALGIMIGNGELDILTNQENDIELASENISLVMPADYSVWATINEDDGSEN
jgi:hypothetical protein